MTDADLSDLSSTSDVNYSDIDFDTPYTTDLKLSDASDPCDSKVSFERVRRIFLFVHRFCVPIVIM